VRGLIPFVNRGPQDRRIAGDAVCRITCVLSPMKYTSKAPGAFGKAVKFLFAIKVSCGPVTYCAGYDAVRVGTAAPRSDSGRDFLSHPHASGGRVVARASALVTLHAGAAPRGGRRAGERAWKEYGKHATIDCEL